MPEPTLHAGPVDLDALDAFLMSDRAPEGSMDLSDLDGFLTGIVVGPELILPSEWLPVAWGGAEPAFESVDEAHSVLGTIMGRYNETVRALDAACIASGSPPKLQRSSGRWPMSNTSADARSTGIVE